MTPLKVCSRPGCSNVFETDGAQKYCSAACRQRVYRTRHKYVTESRFQKRINCRNCGKIFYTHIKSRQYCSDRCKQQHYRERKKLSKET